MFEAGDVAFELAQVSEDRLDVDPQRQAGAGGMVAFNRPPRSRVHEPADPLSPPEQVREQAAQRFSLVSAVGPLVLGGVMVILLHNILFALFCLLSPVLVIGNWWESRRQTGKATRGARREHAEQLARFSADVSGRNGTRGHYGRPRRRFMVHRIAGKRDRTVRSANAALQTFVESDLWEYALGHPLCARQAHLAYRA